MVMRRRYALCEGLEAIAVGSCRTVNHRRTTGLKIRIRQAVSYQQSAVNTRNALLEQCIVGVIMEEASAVCEVSTTVTSIDASCVKNARTRWVGCHLFHALYCFVCYLQVAEAHDICSHGK